VSLAPSTPIGSDPSIPIGFGLGCCRGLGGGKNSGRILWGCGKAVRCARWLQLSSLPTGSEEGELNTFLPLPPPLCCGKVENSVQQSQLSFLRLRRTCLGNVYGDPRSSLVRLFPPDPGFRRRCRWAILLSPHGLCLAVSLLAC